MIIRSIFRFHFDIYETTQKRYQWKKRGLGKENPQPAKIFIVMMIEHSTFPYNANPNVRI